MVVPQLIAWFVTIRLGLHWSGVPLTTACPLRPFPLRIVPALLVASFGATILLLEMASWIPMPESIRRDMTQQIARVQLVAVSAAGGRRGADSRGGILPRPVAARLLGSLFGDDGHVRHPRYCLPFSI